MGISWFWLFGALFLAQFPAYTKNVLGGSETAVTLLLATFTFGIGAGSLLCEKLSAQTRRTGPGAAGLDRPDAVRARPGTCLARRALAFAAGCDRPARLRPDLARAFRPGPARHLRRLLHRAALRPGAAALESGARRAHHRRQQHHERAVHGGRRARRRRHAGRGPFDPDAVRRRGGLQRCGGAVHLRPGAGVPAALHRLDADPHGVSPARAGARAGAGRGPGGDRLQPRQLRRCTGDHGGLPASDPLRHGSPYLPLAGAELRLSAPARPSRSLRQRKTRR